MKHLIRLLWYGTLLGALSSGPYYPTPTAVHPSHQSVSIGAVFLTLMNQRLREQKRAPFRTNLPLPGSVRILRILVLNDSAAAIGTYPLRHAARGCSGTIRMTAFRSHTKWGIGGLVANMTCLSSRLPLEYVWSRSVSGDHTLLVMSGRALPNVVSIRLIRKPGGNTDVPLQNGAFVIFGPHSGIKLVQALDARGHVLYQTKPGGL